MVTPTMHDVYDAPSTVPAILLVLVLTVSGCAKLAARSTADEAFISLRLPVILRKIKAPALLPFGELALAVVLVFAWGWLQLLAAVAAVLLFIAYTVVIVRALTFREPVQCSCFGKLGLGDVDVFTAVRNLLLVGLAALTLVDAAVHRSIAARLANFDGGQWCWLAGVLAAVVLTWLIAGHRGEAGAVNAAAPSADGEYLRAPTPFVALETVDGTTIALRDLPTGRPAAVFVVSPSCGSCVSVIEKVRAWQHTVPHVRTVIVLPSFATDTYHGLIDPQDFEVYFDPQATLTQMVRGGTPTALLLGADDLIAAGPAIGGPAVASFMDDIAAQQEPAMNKVATPTVTTGTMVTEDPTFDYTSTSVTTTPLAEVTDDGIEDYERRPTPFALLADGEGNRVSMISMADSGPVVLLMVSPGCGSCLPVIEQAQGWEAQLRGIPVRLVVTHESHLQPLHEQGYAPKSILIDEHNALLQMFGSGTPTLVALGPDRYLLAGPVSGSQAITEAMEEIIAEVAAARPEAGDGDRADALTDSARE